jgi:hypothetical protein
VETGQRHRAPQFSILGGDVSEDGDQEVLGALATGEEDGFANRGRFESFGAAGAELTQGYLAHGDLLRGL